MDYKKILMTCSVIFIAGLAYAKRADIRMYFQSKLGEPPIQVTVIEARQTSLMEVISAKGVYVPSRKSIAVLELEPGDGKKCFRGMKAVVSVEGHSNYIEGKVSKSYRRKDGKYIVEVPLGGEPMDMVENTPLHASLHGKELVSVLAVPWTAIQQDEDGMWVWLLDIDGIPEVVPISLTSWDDHIAGVEGDIHEGQWVILSPPEGLCETSRLEVSHIYRDDSLVME